MEKLTFKLDQFEGPLDLLLHLIAKHKLHDLSVVEAFIEKSQSEIKLLTDYRKTLYRKIDRCRESGGKGGARFQAGRLHRRPCGTPKGY